MHAKLKTARDEPFVETVPLPLPLEASLNADLVNATDLTQLCLNGTCHALLECMLRDSTKALCHVKMQEE